MVRASDSYVLVCLEAYIYRIFSIDVLDVWHVFQYKYKKFFSYCTHEWSHHMNQETISIWVMCYPEKSQKRYNKFMLCESASYNWQYVSSWLSFGINIKGEK